jgi:multiple sugar transport system ATP-binding protein
VEAVALADKIVVMHAGRIEQVGTYQELTEDPANIFVAGFLGLPPMDLFPSGSVSGRRLVLDDYSFPIPDHMFSIVEDGQQVTIGLRRDDVKISAENLPNAGIHFRAEVESVETDLVHRVQIVFIRMGRLAYSGVCPMDQRLHKGQLIHVEINPDRLYFFDTITGVRL